MHVYCGCNNGAHLYIRHSVEWCKNIEGYIVCITATIIHLRKLETTAQYNFAQIIIPRLYNDNNEK